MRIQRIDADQPTVVVLGAGASRGASFVGGLPGTLPPLDADFFTQAQRLSRAKSPTHLTSLIENVVSLFGSNFNLTMEGYLTHVEYLSNVFEDYKQTGRPPSNPYPAMRVNFLQVLAAVLDEAIGRQPECLFHRVLVDKLDPGDAILSFNYDWLIDETLKRNAPGKWNPHVGYGVEAYVEGTRGKGTRYWAASDPATGSKVYPQQTVTLLKMHGSMNWFPVPDTEDIKLRLRQRWWHQNGDLDFEIAPPEWNKPLRAGVYRKVWQKARSVLKRANALVFIGYSMPLADLPAQALFMVDAPPNGPATHLRLLAIVNPDRAARSRIRETLRNRIDESTRVLTFDSFEEFARFIDIAA